MENKFSYTVKGGRLIRLMGWLLLVIPFGIGAAVIIPAITNSSLPEDMAFSVIVFLISVLISLAYLKVGASLKNHSGSARVWGVVLAALALFSVPLGTIIGVIAFYYLYRGRHEVQSST